MPKPTLILMTHEFPYGNSETSFIGPEIKYLYQHFNIPCMLTFPGGGNRSEISKETEVVVVDDRRKYSIPFLIKLKFYAGIFLPWLLKLIVKSIRYRIGLNNFKIQISQMLKYLHLASFINKKNKSINAVILYSYWFDHWNVAACIYKKLYNTDIKIVSRAHRYEIDVEASKLGFFPFAQLQLQTSDGLYFISSTWLLKIQNKYADHKDKMFLSRMGVYEGVRGPSPSRDKIKILSISGNIPVKQMELQAQALTLLDFSVEWHHYGGNKNEVTLNEIIANSKVDYFNHGIIEINELLKIIGSEPFHFLLNTSKIEGVPVSMMECIACGIPIIGINVGGVSELVNEQTGILLNPKVTAHELAEVLKGALLHYNFQDDNRMRIQEFFKENFHAAKNYPHFCNQLLKLSEK